VILHLRDYPPVNKPNVDTLKIEKILIIDTFFLDEGRGNLDSAFTRVLFLSLTTDTDLSGLFMEKRGESI
jgi:hypothetical protein